ncbi:MAG: hypothetical protein DRJ38_01165 [Thermoprotei archaeon]|nr:MAG: hypothetical protein DRJ38_01165 [Thermoprotei archaeon]
MQNIDVVVVGAGPAALMFARSVASRGIRVVIFEKEKTLAVKPCGEGISSRVLETAQLPRYTESFFVYHKIKKAIIYAPNGTAKEIAGEGKTLGYIVDKKSFLQVMANYAVEAGAEIQIGEKVRKVEPKYDGYLVYTDKRSIKTRVLVGADGYLSLVAKQTGLERRGERKVIPSLQYVMVNVKLHDSDATEFYLGSKVAPLGYAWVFPKSENIANVGIGVQKAAAREYLNKFVRDHPEMFSKSQIVEFKGAAVTISGQLKRIVDNYLLLIGEAAGQVIPLTGGGIHTSIAGGKIAGEVVVEAFDKEDFSRQFLQKYPLMYNEYWGKRIRDSLKALKVIEGLSDEDLNLLAEVLDSRDVLDLANGENIKRVAFKLLKHPILSVKVAKALLS